LIQSGENESELDDCNEAYTYAVTVSGRLTKS